MEVAVLKLHYIYLFIGISTLALNFVLTMHIIKKPRSRVYRGNYGCDDVITFRLTRNNNAEGFTTAAAFCDETAPLE